MNKFFCPISGSKDFKKLFFIKKFPIFMGVSKYPKNYKFQNLKWWINKKSGNVQINPKIPINLLYFKPHGSGTIGKVWTDHHNLFYNLVKSTLKGQICEIGGGNNSVLNKIKNFQKINTFYSFDKNLNLKNKNKKIIKVKKFFNFDYFKKKQNLKFDLVLHSHTFEHLYKPDDFLKTIKFILSKNGKHIFTMPNMKAMIKRGYANAMNFEHPFYYDEKLVDNLLFKNDFKILKKKYFKKDHSIMYVTKLSYKKKLYSYQRFYQNIKLFKNMFAFWNSDIFKINQKIKNRKVVFIFGGHVFSQMILFNGLIKKNIVGILDNDKNKINNYLYGTKFKIFDPKHLKKFNKPSVILRAGSYNDEIKKQIYKINPKTIII